MRCEAVRPLLPELAEGGLRVADGVEAHLASCADCSSELARYRMVVAELAGLSEVLMEAPVGLLDRLLAGLPAERSGVVDRLHRAASDERVHRAAFSVGGAAVGAAAAVGVLWWRRAHRTLRTEPDRVDALKEGALSR